MLPSNITLLKMPLPCWRCPSVRERRTYLIYLLLGMSQNRKIRHARRTSEIAAIMLAGVRVGASPYWPTRFRWGYGWPYFRGYKPLSTSEKRAVKAKDLRNK